MSGKESKSQLNEWTQWFVWLLMESFKDYEGRIEFTTEYELFSKPPRIDVVIVKLLEDFVIENTVGKFFNRHNIIEFKSPKDTLNIESFKKVIGYSFFYMSQNNIEIEDTAISFVSVRYPKKMIGYLEKRNFYEIIPSQDSGIYYINPKSNLSPLPKMQLVVSSQLSAEDVQWLELLRDNLTAKNLEKCFDLYEQTEKYREQIEEVLRGLFTANSELLRTEEIMTVAQKRFNENFAYFAERTGMAKTWEQRGIQQGVQKLLDLLEKGVSLTEAKRMVLAR